MYNNYDAGTPSKQAALAAALNGRQDGSPPPQYIAAPRPGYAAPIDSLNSFSRPEAAATPTGRQQVYEDQGRNPFDNSHAIPSPNPFSNANAIPGSPGIPNSPYPLQAPVTPITPVFARPHSPEVKFATNEKSAPIRGGNEDTLLPRRGERGDDFWKRFSMVVKTEERTKGSSSWLKKTEGTNGRMSSWILILGVILGICVAGGIGIGWYISHNSPDHERPLAIGGSDNEANVGETSSVGVRTSLHVSPTNTVDRREEIPVVTSIPLSHSRKNRRRYNFDLD